MECKVQPTQVDVYQDANINRYVVECKVQPTQVDFYQDANINRYIVECKGRSLLYRRQSCCLILIDT